MPQTLQSLPFTDAFAVPSAPLQVVIAEGQGLARAGFRLLLERQDGVVVTAAAASSDEAVAVTRATRPDVVLIDADLPGGGGFATTRRILEHEVTSSARVVMLMTSESEEAVFGALRAGADGLLLKDTEPETLITAIRAVAAGDAMLDPVLARRLVDDFVARPEVVCGTPEGLEELTAREREVTTLVAHGLSNEEIAARLFVTRATAKTHVSRVLSKLNVRDRAQLVVLAYELGLVRPGTRVSAAPPARSGAARGHSAAPKPIGTVTHIGRARPRSRLHPVAA
ncbi:DNA-binding NarL/FixJ family response regulator [Solirubrobacter pauli]|uniref:DNA-binding NarL/FixJ family response regulator n=1 Tax=Solirubrobacter pauli TaxID=166793 RepID=A0A660KYZ6_9ACTN|nr:response regulator transcription factor [Solirubrobacter pauli]RKQ86866.1 DNA-binding NarL/FixJ family response regulator [Solirubrobacter pauli]